MFKKIALIVSLLFILVSENAFAHSHLIGSNPKNGEVLTNSLNEMELNFGTKIEQTASITLKTKGGATIPLLDIKVEGSSLKGKMPAKLENGDYNAHWKIIGSDGHPIEGDLFFKVNIEKPASSDNEEVQPTEDNGKKAEAVQNQPETDGKLTANAGSGTIQDKSPNTADLDKNSISSLHSYIIPGIASLLILAGVGAYWFFIRKRLV